MFPTVRKGVDRLAVALLSVTLFTLTVGGGVLYALLIILGECSGGGSTGCTM